ASQRLDFYHASQHLWAVAHALHRDDAQAARQWIEPLLKKLKAGRAVLFHRLTLLGIAATASDYASQQNTPLKCIVLSDYSSRREIPLTKRFSLAMILSFEQWAFFRRVPHPHLLGVAARILLTADAGRNHA
ncbi:MAG TPA: hypothetical protein VN873_14495, partial [Candidatus Angelobacter sp.]|nr:hypothetical protein [Candidatus Angelobacter sp.]